MNIQRLILETLETVHPNGLAEKTLLAEINLRSAEPIVPSAFRRELNALVPTEVGQVEDRDQGFVYTIKTRGRARIS